MSARFVPRRERRAHLKRKIEEKDASKKSKKIKKPKKKVEEDKDKEDTFIGGRSGVAQKFGVKDLENHQQVEDMFSQSINDSDSDEVSSSDESDSESASESEGEEEEEEEITISDDEDEEEDEDEDETKEIPPNPRLSTTSTVAVTPSNVISKTPAKKPTTIEETPITKKHSSQDFLDLEKTPVSFARSTDARISSYLSLENQKQDEDEDEDEVMEEVVDKQNNSLKRKTGVSKEILDVQDDFDMSISPKKKEKKKKKEKEKKEKKKKEKKRKRGKQGKRKKKTKKRVFAQDPDEDDGNESDEIQGEDKKTTKTRKTLSHKVKSKKKRKKYDDLEEEKAEESEEMEENEEFEKDVSDFEIEERESLPEDEEIEKEKEKKKTPKSARKRTPKSSRKKTPKSSRKRTPKTVKKKTPNRKKQEKNVEEEKEEEEETHNEEEEEIHNVENEENKEKEIERNETEDESFFGLDDGGDDIDDFGGNTETEDESEDMGIDEEETPPKKKKKKILGKRRRKRRRNKPYGLRRGAYTPRVAQYVFFERFIENEEDDDEFIKVRHKRKRRKVNEDEEETINERDNGSDSDESYEPEGQRKGLNRSRFAPLMFWEFEQLQKKDGEIKAYTPNSEQDYDIETIGSQKMNLKQTNGTLLSYKCFSNDKIAKTVLTPDDNKEENGKGNVKVLEYLKDKYRRKGKIILGRKAIKKTTTLENFDTYFDVVSGKGKVILNPKEKNESTIELIPGCSFVVKSSNSYSLENLSNNKFEILFSSQKCF